MTDRRRLARAVRAHKLRPIFVVAKRPAVCGWCCETIDRGDELTWCRDLRLGLHVECLVEICKGVAA